MAEMIPEDQGGLVLVHPPDPAVATDLFYQIPARVRWRLISVTMRFTADVNTANRFFNLDILDIANILARFLVREEMIASQVKQITWCACSPTTMDAAHGAAMGGFPENLLLNERRVISTVVENIQAGDQIDNVYIMAEEWIEPLV